MTEVHWDSPTPGIPTLCEKEIHLWRAFRNLLPDQANTIAKFLSPEERFKAFRFKFQKDQIGYIATYGYLRLILSSYLSLSTDSFIFLRNSFGKPFLGFSGSRPPIHFNLSHSGDLILIAITLHYEVGVDLEKVRPVESFESIYERFFSPLERFQLYSLPEEKRLEAFFFYWTCKEAYIKAKGEGLSMPLDRFSILPDAWFQDVRLELENSPVEADQWSIRSFSPLAGYIGALAVRNKNFSMRTFSASDLNLEM